MTRRSMAAVSLALTLTACGGGEELVDPASLDDCPAIAGAAIGVIQDSIDVMEAASEGTEPDPVEVEQIETMGAALETRAGEIGCTDDEIADLMVGLADTLEADSVFGQLIIEGLKAGEGAFFEEG